MNGSRAIVGALLGDLAGQVPGNGPEVAVCPTFVHLGQALDSCKSTPVAVGAQDCSHAESGAYTGEVATKYRPYAKGSPNFNIRIESSIFFGSSKNEHRRQLK